MSPLRVSPGRRSEPKGSNPGPVRSGGSETQWWEPGRVSSVEVTGAHPNINVDSTDLKLIGEDDSQVKINISNLRWYYLH